MTADPTEDRPVVETKDTEHLSTCSLVLSAVGIKHKVITLDNGQAIVVSAEDEERAHHHLTSYHRENRNWPPPVQQLENPPASSQAPTLFVVGALLLFYSVTGPWDSHSLWFAAGAGDSRAILEEGEFFRLVTPLTLHADLTHLLGNCIFGGFLLHFFCRLTGAGLGFATVLAASVLANYVNVLLRGAGHLFIGYSTAVFATIGLLVMTSFHRRRKTSLLQMILPFMAGAALLAMTGSSGERTDLGAHFFGLLAGFAIGSLLNTDSFTKIKHMATLQIALLLTSGLVVYLCWATALKATF